MVQMYDVWVLVATSSVPLGLVVCTEVLKHSGRMSAPQARKFLHIGQQQPAWGRRKDA